MVMEFFRRSGESGLDHIANEVQSMVHSCHTTFTDATAAVFGTVDPASVKERVRTTDQSINLAEQEVRRLLVVHASVSGGQDAGLMLAYMNVVKDLERIGDYNKNILDLALDDVTVTDGDLRSHAEELGQRIKGVGQILSDQDEEVARLFIERGDVLRRSFDDAVSALIRSEEPAASAVPRVLLQRYFKRINAHSTNVVSAVVMPLDRIDYFDEDQEDRVGSD
jgi:phosphate transport system protein